MQTLRGTSVPLLVLAVALVLASSGGAVAGSLITGASVRDRSLTGVDIKQNSLEVDNLSIAAQQTLTSDTSATAGTPALAEVVQWTVTSPDPIVNTTPWPTSWLAVGAPSVDTIPPHSRLTFIDATADVDTSACTGEFKLYFAATEEGSTTETGIGGWGQLGPDYVEAPDWTYGYTPSAVGNIALLTGDNPYHLITKGSCYSQGPDNPIKRDLPPVTATVTLLVESLPSKAERILQ